MTKPASTYWASRVASIARVRGGGSRSLLRSLAGRLERARLQRRRIEDRRLIVGFVLFRVLEDHERRRPLVPVHAGCAGKRRPVADPRVESPPLELRDDAPGVAAAGLVHRLGEI